MPRLTELPDPTINILDIDINIQLQLYKILSLDVDQLNELKAAPYRYEEKRYSFFRFEDDIDAKQLDTGEKLYRKWGGKGMPVETLMMFLDDIKLERALLLIRPHGR